MSEYNNPFKDPNFKNPGKTLEESKERVEKKLKRIKELENERDRSSKTSA